MKNPIKCSSVNGDLQVVLWQDFLDYGVDVLANGQDAGGGLFEQNRPASERCYLNYCTSYGLDPEPERTKRKNLHEALVAVGWVHVHTWEESHGEYRSEYFEKPAFCPGAPTHHLILNHYRGVQPTELWIDSKPRGSYLLAKEILADETKRWEPCGPKRISSCCTASYQDFRNQHNGACYRIEDAVGHGAVAIELGAGDNPH